jgi:hypothetical protein
MRFFIKRGYSKDLALNSRGPIFVHRSILIQIVMCSSVFELREKKKICNLNQ